jgi:protein gp37
VGSQSKIEWTDATWPVVQGCDPVSPGCLNCYAISLMHRHAANPNQKISLPVQGLTKTSGRGPIWTGKLALREDRLGDPLRWRKPKMVFVPSHGDIFHEGVPDAFLAQVYLTMFRAKHHTFQVLTKRAERLVEWSRKLCYDDGGERLYLDETGRGRRLLGLPEARHIWHGVSVENVATSVRLDHLTKATLGVRFVSLEPLLEFVDVTKWLYSEYDRYAMDPRGATLAPAQSYTASRAKLNWAIVGGESGVRARPFDVDWARTYVEHCRAAGCALFVKQMGAKPFVSLRDANNPGYRGAMEIRYNDSKGGNMSEWPPEIRVREFPETGGDA